MLRARLLERDLAEREAEQVRLRGDLKAVDFGSQIRSYVLHPYRMVKDVRTGVEVGNAQAVLDGDLDVFIDRYLRETAPSTVAQDVEMGRGVRGPLAALLVALALIGARGHGGGGGHGRRGAHGGRGLWRRHHVSPGSAARRGRARPRVEVRYGLPGRIVVRRSPGGG